MTPRTFLKLCAPLMHAFVQQADVPLFSMAALIGHKLAKLTYFFT